MRASTRFCLKVFITLFSYRSLSLSTFNSKALIYLSLAGFTLVSPDSLASSLLLLLSLSSRSFFSNVSFSLSYPANIEGRGSSSISFFLPDASSYLSLSSVMVSLSSRSICSSSPSLRTKPTMMSMNLLMCSSLREMT